MSIEIFSYFHNLVGGSVRLSHRGAEGETPQTRTGGIAFGAAEEMAFEMTGGGASSTWSSLDPPITSLEILGTRRSMLISGKRDFTIFLQSSNPSWKTSSDSSVTSSRKFSDTTFSLYFFELHF